MNTKKTATIIINWNGYSDTIECLKSFDADLTSQYVFIIDNDSADTSIQKLTSYFTSAEIAISVFEEGVDKKLVFNKNIHFYLIKGKANRGFAGGNNFVIDLLLPEKEFLYFWLLNNDTVIEKNSLPELIKTLEEDTSTGFAGSVIMDYSDRNKIQCCGCRLYPYLGVAKMILKDKSTHDINSVSIAWSDYQSGASLIVTREVIEKTGSFDLNFFMYSEECDWQIRSLRAGYKNTLASKSFVYHKGTVSTEGRKHLFYYYYNRSSMILVRKNFSWLAKISAPLALAGITLIRTRASLKNFYYGLKGIIHGLCAPINPL